MGLDLSEYFKKYEQIVAEVDRVFETVKSRYADLVPCGKGCSDCCHALFDVTLIEALYLNHHFNQKFEGKQRSDIIDRADRADRDIHKFKRKLFKASQEGRSTEEILQEVARTRVRCPLLGETGLCDLYEQRPITCRVYGVPTAIGDEVHTCGKTGFVQGESYPSVRMDILHERLTALSKELVEGLGSLHKRMWDMVVPASMALLTDYDEAYLGIPDEAAPKPQAAPSPAPAPEPESKPESADAESPGACSECGEASGCASFSEGGTCSCGSFSVTLGETDKPKR